MQTSTVLIIQCGAPQQIYLEFTIKYMDPHDLDDGVIPRSGKGSAHLRTPYPSNPSKLQFFGGYRMGLQK